MPKPIISCVIDNYPKFHMQGWNWAVSLHTAGAFEDFQLVVHHVGPPPDYFRHAMDFFSIELEEIEKFGDGHAVYSNKLQQLEPLLARDAGCYILSDADLAYRKSPIDIVSAESIRAKLVDLPNPPTHLLGELFNRAGFKNEPLDALPSFSSNDMTHRFNCNGGLYVIPRKLLTILSGSWRRWARFCLKQEKLLGGTSIHADQLGFMFAMIELGLPFSPLPDAENFPTHICTEKYRGEINMSPSAFHYHDRIDERGLLSAASIAPFANDVAAINERLGAYFHLDHYSNINAAFRRSIAGG